MQSERRDKAKAVARALAGNILEVYDYSVYGFYAVYIAAAFFPTDSAFLSLMLSLMTFGIAAIARPFGAIILGSYTDRKGRRLGLLLTLALMSVGSLTIAFTPGYATIGILAPLLIVIGRLIQGFAFGAESSSVNVYLAEIATPGNHGFYIAWQNASQGITLSLTAGMGVLLAATLSNEQMAAWGWRVPFVIGCLVIPILFWLRSSLQETEVFLKSRPPRGTGEVLKILARHSPVLILALGLWILQTTAFYLMLTYTPTFGSQALHLTAIGSLLVTACAGFSFFIVNMLGGVLSDRYGRWPLVITAAALILGTAFPAYYWLAAAPSFERLLAVDLWLSLLLGIYSGGVVPLIAELMPPAARTTGMGMVISIGSGLFGSFMPAIGTLLIEMTGSPAAPALWLTATAVVALAAAVAVRRFAPVNALHYASV